MAMSWTRHFEMKDEGKSLGEVRCSFSNESSEFSAEFIFSDPIFFQNYQEKNGRWVGFTVPTPKINAKSEEELMKTITDQLKSIGKGITIDQILK